MSATFDELVHALLNVKREAQAVEESRDNDPDVTRAREALLKAKMDVEDARKWHDDKLSALAVAESEVKAKILEAWPDAQKKTIKTSTFEVQRRVTPKLVVTDPAKLVQFAVELGIHGTLIESVTLQKDNAKAALKVHPAIAAVIKQEETVALAAKAVEPEAIA